MVGRDGGSAAAGLLASAVALILLLPASAYITLSPARFLPPTPNMVALLL